MCLHEEAEHECRGEIRVSEGGSADLGSVAVTAAASRCLGES